VAISGEMKYRLQSRVPYSITSVGHWADPGFLAVNLQVTFVINPVVGCHYFPPGPRLLSQPKITGVLQKRYLAKLSGEHISVDFDCWIIGVSGHPGHPQWLHHWWETMGWLHQCYLNLDLGKKTKVQISAGFNLHLKLSTVGAPRPKTSQHSAYTTSQKSIGKY